jgi:uncharacterized damage-inducible protein DinB
LKENLLRKLAWITLICIAAPGIIRAQAKDPNPVAASVREVYNRHSRYLVAAAEEMPAEKYSYRPTPEEGSFGQIIAHIAQVNLAVCSMVSDIPAPAGPKLSETDPKDTLTAALKASFDFCDQAVAKLQDASMGDTITFFRGAKKMRSRAVIELVDDLNDHYSQLAIYLRLNGMVPPSAKPQS